MRHFKKFLGVILSACFLLSFLVPAYATYDYQVTMSGGNYGEVSKDSETFKYEERWNPNDYTVTVTNEKYYFKGFHISGQEGLVGAMKITKDTDFVATYGIKGETVAYTVNYEDRAGNPVADSATFYGNVGDKPIVAYIYIEGYQPQAYNITKTLSADESENVFTFVYTPVASEEEESESSESGGGQGGGGNESSESGSESSESGESSESSETPESSESGENSENSGSESSEPEEIIDDDDTPLGPFETPLAMGLMIGGGSVLVLLVAFLLIYFLGIKKRRNKNA